MGSGYFSDWLKSYRNYLRMRNYSSRTLDSYEQVIKHFGYYVWLRRHTEVTKLVFFWKDFENARLDTSVDVPPSMITDFLSFVSTMRTYKPKTFHRIISTLSSFYRFLSTQGAVVANPLSGIERPRIKQQEVKYLKHNQVLRLIDSIEDPRDKLIVRTIYSTGVRVSELCNIISKISISMNIPFVSVGKVTRTGLSSSMMRLSPESGFLWATGSTVPCLSVSRASTSLRGLSSIFSNTMLHLVSPRTRSVTAMQANCTGGPRISGLCRRTLAIPP